MSNTSTRKVILLLAVATLLSPAAIDLFAEQANAPNGIQGRADAVQNQAQPGAEDFRHREGSPFESQGDVQYAGDRLTFVSSDGKERLTMLENLALDRVARTVRDTTIKAQWKVYGTVTEYQGANYLMLERAVTVRVDTGAGL